MKVPSVGLASKIVLMSVVGTGAATIKYNEQQVLEKTNNDMVVLKEELIDYKRTVTDLQKSLDDEKTLNQHQAKILQELGQTINAKTTLDQINTVV